MLFAEIIIIFVPKNEIHEKKRQCGMAPLSQFPLKSPNNFP
jgi:hypothetical protein